MFSKLAGLFSNGLHTIEISAVINLPDLFSKTAQLPNLIPSIIIFRLYKGVLMKHMYVCMYTGIETEENSLLDLFLRFSR